MPAAPSPAIRLDRVAKGFGPVSQRVQVLDGLSLDVGEHELVAVFGANGSGKTTLLNILAGALSPDAGEMTPTASELNVGYVFQAYDQSLLPWLTCLDNIALPLFTKGGQDQPSARTAVRQKLSRFGIDLPLSRYPYQLSGGQKQLACLARALVVDPNFLLLDEPFASLDYLNRLSLLATVQRLWLERPIPTVFVSHDVDEAILLADRILVLAGKPARIQDSVEVQLSRPRDLSVLSTAAVGEIRSRVLSHFPVSAL